MSELNFSIDNAQIREIFTEAVKSEGIKAYKQAIADDEIRGMIRQVFRQGYANKSLMQKAIDQNLDSAVTRAVWDLFDEPEIKQHLRTIVKAEIESDEFGKLIRQAVMTSAWSSYVKINPEGVVAEESN